MVCRLSSFHRYWYTGVPLTIFGLPPEGLTVSVPSEDPQQFTLLAVTVAAMAVACCRTIGFAPKTFSQPLASLTLTRYEPKGNDFEAPT